MKVLGIETSCDETGVAIVSNRHLLANCVATQEAIHTPFGGVVPELASRRHLETLPHLTRKACELAGIPLHKIEGVSVTTSPGLLPALLMGLSFAKAIAFANNIPFVGVNHLEGHLNSIFLEHSEAEYPFCCMVVSGGHTSLYHAAQFGDYRLLGATRDDAAGEAYDKVAKLLGLGFPGGPDLDRLAKKGNPKAFSFKLPKFSDEARFEFSFSGIKTAVRNLVQQQKVMSEEFKQNIAASFQEQVTNTLVIQMQAAADHCKTRRIAVAGGVAANSSLREKLKTLKEKNYEIFVPSMQYCTDNAAMIAYVGEQYLTRGKRSPWDFNATAVQELG